jgi:hypothetical protein
VGAREAVLMGRRLRHCSMVSVNVVVWGGAGQAEKGLRVGMRGVVARRGVAGRMLATGMVKVRNLGCGPVARPVTHDGV